MDSSYNRFHQELKKMRIDFAIIAYQLVVTQLSRNPIQAVEHEPSKRLWNALTVSYDVDLFDHGQSV